MYRVKKSLLFFSAEIEIRKVRTNTEKQAWCEFDWFLLLFQKMKNGLARKQVLLQ